MLDFPKFNLYNNSKETKMKIRSTYSVLANSLNKAIANRESRAKFYSGESDMVNMCRKDMRDLILIRNHVIKGRFDLAARKAKYLDTDVRELIPNRLFSILTDI